MKKKQNVTIEQGRSVTTFFNRVLENFERKFDGFPALIEGARETPAIAENSDPYLSYNPQDIIDAIARSVLDASIPPCQTIEGELIENAGAYVTPTPSKYVKEVWYDGMLVVKDVDYSEIDGGIQPFVAPDVGVVIRARWVAL